MINFIRQQWLCLWKILSLVVPGETLKTGRPLRGLPEEREL